MPQLNRVYLAGNLTRDPEVRYLPSGMAVADLGLAVDDNYKDKDGNLKERTLFVDISVWGRQAETCRDYLSKGSPVLVEGRLRLDEWKNQQGEKRTKLKVNADRVQFLGSPRRSAEMGDAPEGRRGKPARSEEAPPTETVSDQLPPDDPGAGGDDLPF
jgi:single-strand DNA-binding protein